MRLGLGCVGLGSGAGRSVVDDVRLVRAAIDLGVTVFDTADAYGGGASEHVLGRGVRRRRDEVVIATKGGYVFRDRPRAEQWARRWAKPAVAAVRQRSGPATEGAGAGSYGHQDFSARHLRDAVHASLRRLRTDRIDVYQLHGPPEVLPDLLDELSDLVVIGDVGRYGVGAQSVTIADGWMPVGGMSVIQVPFGILDPGAASTTLPLARQLEREVWARGVLGGGLLAQADRDSGLSPAHHRSPMVGVLQQIAADAGLDQYELAFRFLRSYAGDVSTALVGTTSLLHLRRNLELLSSPPLDDDMLSAVLRAHSVEDPS